MPPRVADYLITGNSSFGTPSACIEQVQARPREWVVSLRRNVF